MSAIPSPVRASGWPLASLSLAMLLSSLGTSIANVGLPSLAVAFAAPVGEVQWVVIAYLLAMTTLIVSIGRLGDLVGRRRLMLAGIALYLAASVACGIAPALWLLILARAVQGLGAAAMMALAMALVGETIPKERTGAAMGLLGTMSAIGTALGPSIGGILIAAFGWPAIFLGPVPVGLAALGLAWRALPVDRIAPERPAFDRPGTLVLAATLAAYALAMTVGHGSFGPSNMALLAAAAAGAAIFVAVERRSPAPLVRLAGLGEPPLGPALLAGGLVATVMMTTLVVGPFYLVAGLGLNAAQAGLVMSAGPVVSALSGVPAGRLADRIGTRRAALAGLAGIAAGAFGLALLPSGWGIPAYIVPLLVMTPGYALFQAANNAAAMADVPADRRGTVSGLLNLSRNLGLITGASLMGAVFSLAAGGADAGAAARGMHATFAVAGLMAIAAAAAIAGNGGFPRFHRRF